MHDERQRDSRPERLRRRGTDLVEDLAAWLLLALALLTVVAGIAVGVGVHEAGMHRIDAETRERTQVQAVLLEPAPDMDANDYKGRGARPLVTVAARYTTPDGVEREADARVLGPLPAGATVPIWVDRSGVVADAPMAETDLLGRAVTDALGVLALGAVVLGGIWTGIRWTVLRINMDRWEREWEQVEPRWSGRTPR